jgi:hypothetical protein
LSQKITPFAGRPKRRTRSKQHGLKPWAIARFAQERW